MKRCSKCGETKPLSEFVKNRGKKDGIHSWCKKCHNFGTKKTKNTLRDYARKLKERPCMDCGQEYPWYVMEFDHTRGIKVMEVTGAHHFGSLTLLQEEIDKCDIVCANCHRVRTYNRLHE